MQEHWNNSPCAGCGKVAQPEQCDNKDCTLWRKWFEGKWNFMCGNLLGKWEGKA